MELRAEGISRRFFRKSGQANFFYAVRETDLLVPAGSLTEITGRSGSGKSTFARRLHACTNLPLIHLDNVWWKADRTHISREDFDHRLEKLLQGDKWIIDGDYSRTYEVRFRSCDTIIFLDYSEEECMNGIIDRVGKSRSDIPWTEHQLDPELVKLVRNYNKDNRLLIYSLIDQYPEKQTVIFKTRFQADDWLNLCTAEREKQNGHSKEV